MKKTIRKKIYLYDDIEWHDDMRMKAIGQDSQGNLICVQDVLDTLKNIRNKLEEK